MSKTVNEVLQTMTNETGKNRFNKKNFTTLMTALANDTDFITRVAKVRNSEIDVIEKITVSKGFREFCKKILEKAGLDKNESVIALSDSFEFTNSDFNGFYEFIETAIYEYMNSGNTFEFLPREDFKGSISIKDVPEKTTVAEAFSPKDRTSLGTYETTKKRHKELVAKSSCPVWLKDRKKV